MELFELDLDYNNEVSEVLKKEYPAYNDLYQEAVVYANWRGVKKSQIDEMLSNVDGEEKRRIVLTDFLTKVGETAKAYGATNEGYNIGEATQGNRPNRNRPEKVRILGMEPLVFSLVAFGTVIVLGITFAKLGKKATQ